MRTIKTFTNSLTVALAVCLTISSLYLVSEDVSARQVRGNTRMNINRGANINRNKNVNRNRNINRNTNVNVNRHVDVNVHRHGYRGGYYDHNDGIGVGAAIAIGVAGLAVGSIVTAASMPPSCSMIPVNGITYQRCGSTWYQPQYAGSNVNYVVVNPPR